VYHHILVPLDASTLAERVLPHVMAIASLGDTTVTLTRVLEPPTLAGHATPTDPVAWRLARAEADAYLSRIRETLETHDVHVHTRVVDGTPATALLTFARDHDVDLIAIASHGRSGLAGWNLGGVSTKLVSHARCDVLLVRAFASEDGEATPLRYERILVPLDGSARAECALAPACQLAHAHDAHLYLLHVIEPHHLCSATPLTASDAKLAASFHALHTRLARTYVETHVQHLEHNAPEVHGRVIEADDLAAALHETIADERIDLVIASAHGATGSARWPYGTTLLNLLAYGTTPILVVQDVPARERIASTAERAAEEHAGHA